MPKSPFELPPPRPNAPQPRPTGEFYAATFGDAASNDDVAANEPMYDRRRKTPVKKKKEEPEDEEALDPRAGKYTRLALSPEGGLEAARKEWEHDAMLAYLCSTGIVEKSPDGSIILTRTGKEKLASSGWTKWGGQSVKRSWHPHHLVREKFNLPENANYNLSRQALTAVLTELSAPDPDQPENEPLAITAFPSSVDQVVHGVSTPCLLKPWEIKAVLYDNWMNPIVLESGETTNLAELYIADTLHSLKPTRDATGQLIVDDPKTRGRVPITGELLRPLLPSFANEKGSGFVDQPAVFTQEYLGNLTALDILRPSDFNTFSGFNAFASSELIPADRILSEKTDFVSLRTPGGESLRYYLGKEKIVGTDIPFDHQHMVVRYLDDRTCGIVRISDKHEEVITTFELFSLEEVRVRRDAVRSRRVAEGKSSNESILSQLTSVGAKEVAQRMRLYHVSDFAPQFEGESAKEYADRIAKLNDARLASKTTREFFQQYGIGLHQLPWAEQLAASSILIDPRVDKEEVGAFCKQYGIDGLRTFISSTRGKNINSDILALGAKAPDLARSTFAKYNEILSGIDEVEHSLRLLSMNASLDAGQQDQFVQSIKEKLLHKAKQVLTEVSSMVSQSKKASPKVIQKLSEKLHESQADIELLKATFRTLKDNDADITLEDFRDNVITSERGLSFNPTETKRLRSRYVDSMQGYPTETRDRLLAEFDTHLSDENSRFTLLRHKGEIVGSLCFTEDQPGQKYISAVTLDPRFQKAYIGEAMIDEAFKREARENILGADCVAEKSVSARYIENGFIGVRSWDDKGDLILDIVRDDRRNEQYFKTKAMTQEEIVKLAPLGNIGSAKVEVVSNPQEHSFARCNEGFVLTRYFRDTQTKKWYLVYEPMPVSPQAKKAQRSTEAATA